MLTRHVPSSKGNGSYIVTERDGVWSCSCPHHRYRGAKCKHIVQVQQTEGMDSSAVDDDPESFDPSDFYDGL